VPASRLLQFVGALNAARVIFDVRLQAISSFGQINIVFVCKKLFAVVSEFIEVGVG
jgi:hypothetical protein